MKRTVNVLMGGPSAEHEVSLKTGHEVLTHLNRDIYDVRAVVISKSKKFYIYTNMHKIPSIQELSNPSLQNGFEGPFEPFDAIKIWKGCHIAFLALHGSFGEDGTIQGYLETLGIPYTGSGVFGSAAAMDKIQSKFLYLQNNIPVPPYLIYNGNNFTFEQIKDKLSLPLFIKCPQSGSSRLMGCAKSKDEFDILTKELLNHSQELLIEQTITGIEFSCGVIEMPDHTFRVLPPVEIRPKQGPYFDFEAKYTDGASEEIVPAPRPVEILKQIQKFALDAHRVLKCQGVSRTDMILHKDNLFVLETNTLPGLTTNSLLPKAFKAEGGTFPELLDLFIQNGFQRFGTAL